MGVSCILVILGNVVWNLEILTEAKLSMSPFGHLLNDDTDFGIGRNSRKIWLAGLTAAKKMVAQHWKPPSDISFTHWLHNFLDISYWELSSARINNTRLNIISLWKNLLNK